MDLSWVSSHEYKFDPLLTLFPLNSYGVFSFGLIFIVERLGGILQATLTLNGLVGGVMLGLFSLGVFFKKANSKGALYGGLIALSLVVCLGVMAQIKNVDQPFLESSVAGCDCLINATLTAIPEVVDDDGFFNSWYKISYMWYSCIGTLLTIFFGLLISMITEYQNKREIVKITHMTTMSSLNLPPVASAAHSVGSTLSRTKKISSFISSVAHDVNLQSIKIENKIRELSHVNLNHLNEDNEDRVNIMDEETKNHTKCMKKDTGNGKMFFIGFFEDMIHHDHHKAHDSDASDSEDGKMEDGQSTPPIEKLHGEFNTLSIVDE